MCDCVKACVFLPSIDLTNTLEFFNNKEKRGQDKRPKNYYTYTISFKTHTYTYNQTHTHEYLQNFITIYMYTCLVYTHTNNNELSSYRQAHVDARALNSCILNMCVYTQFICICVYHWIYMWRYRQYYSLSLLFLMMVLKSLLQSLRTLFLLFY